MIDDTTRIILMNTTHFVALNERFSRRSMDAIWDVINKGQLNGERLSDILVFETEEVLKCHFQATS